LAARPGVILLSRFAAQTRVTSTARTAVPRGSQNGIYGKSSSAETLSLRLDVGGPDYLAPFLGFLGDKLAKVGG